MANNKKNDAICAMEDDFAQWYTDIWISVLKKQDMKMFICRC